MPCTNVVLRIAGLQVDEALLNLAMSLARENGVTLYVRASNGALVGGAGAVLDARKWVVAAAAFAEAKRLGYRASVTVKNGKVVVAGVSA